MISSSFRIVFCTLPYIAIRRLRAQSSVGVLGLLLMAASGFLYCFPIFMQHTSNQSQQQQQNNSRSASASVNPVTKVTSANGFSAVSTETLKRIDALVRDKETLEKRVSDCQGEKKSLISLLDTEKEMHQKTNDTLKLLEQNHRRDKNETEYLIRHWNEEKTIQEANLTIHRGFFHYASVMLQNTPYPGVDNYTRYTVARLGMLPLAGIEPLKPEYGPVINNVTSFHYPIAIPACHHQQTLTNQKQQQISVFIAVISAPDNFDKRNTIRQTWRTHLSNASYHNSSMVLAGFAFILGLTDKDNATQSQIKEESQTHGDLIQIEMSDFYRNLSLKVAGLFNWLYRHCKEMDFLFKVDDDVYVNVRNLAHFVHQSNLSNRSDQSIYGNSAGNLFPARDGKWGVTVEEWPWKDYPRYFFGPGVLFPGGTILPLLAAFQTTPLHPVDDLYYSGICSEKAGVKVRWSASATSVMSMGQPAVPDACDLRRLISLLTVSATHMNNSHFATDDFYHNRTQCRSAVAGSSNGTNTTSVMLDYLAEPILFDFN